MKKNQIKKIAALMMTAALTFGTAGHAMAEDSSITYQGGAEAFVTVPEGKDLFQNFKGVMPGDTRKQTVIVSNTVNSKGGVRIYLKAETEEEGTEGFLEQMTLTVVQNGQVLSEGLADQPAGLAENVLLGTFNGKGQIQLDLSLTVPVTMGNEFQDAAGKIRWIFTAEELDGNKEQDPFGGGSGSGGGGGGGGTGTGGGGGTPSPAEIPDGDPALANLEQIDDEAVPLATNPLLEMIEDVLVPLGVLPKTGDGSVTYVPLLTVLAVSGMLIILLIQKRRKKETE
ncbi:MAG: LPXTG cell wall anchor domain-containing protein [Lachnospiraceae bacterium]|jgi:LPXTG-motif cell wall-anchored protein|nr:LPXTG cell wall anchor domain-containing protein [Lachnospiraceae bacterium]